jgi:hypothetical protein
MNDRIRKVELQTGLIVSTFWDPPQGRDSDGVQRWRVSLPGWFPTGSWLHATHSFVSLEAALTALEDTGALDAIEELWKAKGAESAAKHKAMSKVMAAHAKCDRSYSDLVSKRQRESMQRQREAERAASGTAENEKEA